MRYQQLKKRLKAGGRRAHRDEVLPVDPVLPPVDPVLPPLGAVHWPLVVAKSGFVLSQGEQTSSELGRSIVSLTASVHSHISAREVAPAR